MPRENCSQRSTIYERLSRQSATGTETRGSLEKRFTRSRLRRLQHHPKGIGPPNWEVLSVTGSRDLHTVASPSSSVKDPRLRVGVVFGALRVQLSLASWRSLPHILSRPLGRQLSRSLCQVHELRPWLQTSRRLYKFSYPRAHESC